MDGVLYTFSFYFKTGTQVLDRLYATELIKVDKVELTEWFMEILMHNWYYY